MLGLLYKDLLNLKKTLVTYLIITVFYAFLSVTGGNGAIFMGVIIMFAAILPITAISYDERAKWDGYVQTMPIAKSKIVVSKYLLGVIFAVAAIAVCLVIGFLQGADFFETIIVSLSLAALALVMLAVILPIIYRFGSERGRILMMIVLLTPTILILLASKLNLPTPSMELLRTLAYFVPVVAVLLFVGSIFLSIHIYRKKEF